MTAERNTATYVFNGSPVEHVHHRKRQDFRSLIYVRKSYVFPGWEFLEEVAHTCDQSVFVSTFGNNLQDSNNKETCTKYEEMFCPLYMLTFLVSTEGPFHAAPASLWAHLSVIQIISTKTGNTNGCGQTCVGYGLDEVDWVVSGLTSAQWRYRLTNSIKHMGKQGNQDFTRFFACASLLKPVAGFAKTNSEK